MSKTYQFKTKERMKKGIEIMKKTLAIILSVLMIVCMMPGMAFATTESISLTGASISIEGGPYVYEGKSIEPQDMKVILKDSDKEADLDKLDVTYTNNTSAGVATVTVKPKNGNDTYKDSATTTFTIEKASFIQSNFKFKSDIPIPTEGKELTPSDIGMTYNDVLVDSNDVTITGLPEKVTNGNYEVTLTSKGKNFIADKSFKITIRVGTSIADYDIKIKGADLSNVASFTYNGKAQTFDKTDITLAKKNSSESITSDNFDVTYKDNIDAYNGKATIIVKGKDPYIGEVSGTFNISSYKIEQNVSPNEFYIEDLGKVPEASKPTPIVKLGGQNGVQLIAGKDFTYDYSRAASTKGKIKVVIVGKAPNCTGEKYVEYDLGKNIANTTITLDNHVPSSGYPKYTYDGTAHRPTVVVKDGTTILGNGTDYTVTYENYTNASTAAKPAKVIIQGKKDYAGKMEYTYTIEQKSITGLRLAVSSSMAYIPVGGYTTKYMPSFTLYDTNGRVLIPGTDYTVRSYDYTNNTNSAVNISIEGKGNYTGYYYGYNVVLNGTNMAYCRVELAQSSYKYTGYTHTPTVKVYNGSTLVPSTYYIVSYKNNKDIGTASVTVTGTNGYTGSQTVYFTITGNTINTCTATLSQTTYKYDGLYKEPSVTVKDGYTTLTRNVDYRVTYSNNRVAGTASVVITGIGKYSGSMTKEFKIEGLDQTLTTKYTKYTKYPTSSNFNLGASANGDGTGFTYTSSDNSVARVASNGEVEIVGTGIAKITVATKGTTRYNPATKEVTVTVKPNKPVFKLSSLGWGKAKVQITKASGVTKYQIRYGRNGNYKNYYYKYSTSSYKTQSKTFNGLSSGKTYYIKVRAYKTLANGDKVWGNWTTTKKIRVR